MRITRSPILWVLLLGLLVVGVGLWLVPAPPVSRHVFPNGTTVTVLGVSYGTRHRFVDATGWRRTAGVLLPEVLLRRLGISVMSYVTTNPVAVVWLEFDDRALAGRNLLGVSSVVAITDEHGGQFSQIASAASRGRNGQTLEGAVIPILPAGDGDLQVTVQRWEHTIPVSQGRDPSQIVLRQAEAQLVARRPVRWRRPRWAESTLPSTSRVDQLQFVLNAARTFAFPGGGSMRASCWIDGLILEDGLPTTNWVVQAVDVLDGNGGTHRLEVGRPPYGTWTIPVGLSTNQIWRLRFQLARVGGFSAHELVTLRELPITVSERGAFRPLTNVINDTTLVLYDLSGFGVVKLATFLLSDAADYHTVLVSAEDEQRRRLPSVPGPAGLAVQTINDSQTATVTIGVAKLKAVEVLVRPKYSTNHGPQFPSSKK